MNWPMLCDGDYDNDIDDGGRGDDGYDDLIMTTLLLIWHSLLQYLDIRHLLHTKFSVTFSKQCKHFLGITGISYIVMIN